ncbi:hypothetical protein EVAR_62401_1 [Eumeta japonica]|uniref:Pre-C2HC domain-containing protein n=1 Tax=Eumeta variegata TaxID=151549 RepID=A0A4C1ZAK7_EUMVA|nr:hypothetical protein EVAR_62401_1 [Eumeta japonica]
MASRFGDMLQMFKEFSLCKSGPVAQFSAYDLVFLLEEECEIRIVIRGVPKEISVEEVKGDLRSQNLPVQSICRILNHSREPLDLVLFSGTAEVNEKALKAAYYETKGQRTRNKDPDGPSA